MRLITTILLLHLFGCTGDSQREEQANEFKKAFFADWHTTDSLSGVLNKLPDLRMTTLLAIKYNLSPVVVRSIIEEYLAAFEGGHSSSLDSMWANQLARKRKLLDAERITQSVVALIGNETSLAPSTIASIIIEYRTLTNSCDKECSNQQGDRFEDDSYRDNQ